MADGLFEHMTILRDEWPDRPALRTPPAWADYEAGPWPAPHDPIFDFSTTPPGYEWLDDLADYQRARARPFSARQMRQAAGASVWVASYNARCVLALQGRGITAAGPGTSLAVVSACQSGFLALLA